MAITYTLVDDGGGPFEIVGNQLRTTGPLNFETNPFYTIAVRALDSATGKQYTKTFAINVGDVLELAAPTIEWVTAPDNFLPGFEITLPMYATVSDTLRLEWDTASNFPAPTLITRVLTAADLNTGPIPFTVADEFPEDVYYWRASLLHEGELSQNSPAEIVALDTTDPVFTSSATTSVVEHTALTYNITADDEGTASIVGGVDAAQFVIVANQLRFAGTNERDFENPQDDDPDNDYEVTVRWTNLAGMFTDQNIVVTVTNNPADDETAEFPWHTEDDGTWQLEDDTGDWEFEVAA